jgi:phosphoglycolate phosphatase
VHGGKLYPRLEETLLELKKDYKLFVVSNCQQGYIESFIHAHKLSAYFDDIECWGNNRLSKGENNKLIMKRNNVTSAVYVGDTAGDEQSARDAGIPFIFARYGFGQAEKPDYELEEFSKLPELMGKIGI